MDEVDSTVRRPRAKNRHISELEQKLAERRANRLTTDMTSESDDDNVGDLDFGRTNRFMKQRNDSSSNWQPDLGATLKFRDRDALLNTLNEERPSRFMKTSKMNIKNMESPRDNLAGLTADDILSGRKTPTISEDRKSPFLNRKSPLSSQKENGHDWQPLSYQKKAPSPDFLNRDRSFDSNDSHERGLDSPRKSRTDKSPRLEPLESPKEKPSPRPRRGSEDTKKKRSTPTMDLFGSRRSRLDEEEEEEEVKVLPARAQRRLSKEKEESKPGLKGRKTPTDDGRKTPTEKRKSSPDGKRNLSGRKTPTAEGRKTPIEGRKTLTREKSEPSLMEMMTQDEADSKPSPRRRKSLLKETSHDSITQEVNDREPQRTTSSEKKRRGRRSEVEADQSSVCEEYEVDPNPPLIRSNPEPKPREYKHQTEEHERCDEAIDFVEKAQNGMTYIDPDQQDKSEKKNKTIKPRARSARYSPLPSQTLATLDVDPSDTKAMRQAIFNVWYTEKTKRLKEELQKKKMDEKEKTEKEKQEKNDKILEAKASYNAWAEKKKDTLKEKARQKTREGRKKEEEMREIEIKKEHAKKSFEAWKETKDMVIIKETSKKKREEIKKKEEEEMQKRLRAESASSAFRSWKNKKEEYLEKKSKEEKKKKPDLYEEELQRENRDREARKLYMIWLENKEKQQEKERRMRRHSTTALENSRPAWCPAKRTIPFGR